MHWIQDNLLHKRLFFFVSCLRPTKKTSGAENCFLIDLQPIQQFITETVLLPRVHLVKDPHYCYSCPSMLVTITQRTTIILTITNKIRIPTTLQIHQHYCCSLAQHVLACPAKTSSVHRTSKTTEVTPLASATFGFATFYSCFICGFRSERNRDIHDLSYLTCIANFSELISERENVDATAKG